MQLPTQLQGTTPNLTPVVKEASPSGISQALGFASTAITVNENLNALELKKQQATVLSQFQNKLFKIGQIANQVGKDPVKLSQISRLQRQALDQTVQDNPLLQDNLNKLFSTVTGNNIASVGQQSISTQEDLKQQQEKTIQETVLSFGGDPNNKVDRQQSVALLQLKTKALAAQNELNLKQAVSTAGKIDFDKTAVKQVNAFLFATQLSSSKVQDNALANNVEAKVQVKSKITNDFQIQVNKLQELRPSMTEETFTRLSTRIANEEQRQLDLVDGKLTKETYEAQNKINSAIGGTLIAPTPNAAATNKVIQQFGNMRNDSFLKLLISNPGLDDAFKDSGFMQFLLGDTQGSSDIRVRGATDPSQQKKINSGMDKFLSDAADLNFSILTPDDEDVMAKLLGNIATGYEFHPETINLESVDSINRITSSKPFKNVIKGNPKYQEFNSRIERVVTNIQREALRAVNDSVSATPGNVQLSFNSELGRFEANTALTNPSPEAKRLADDLNKNEVRILNNTIVSRANIKGIKPEEEAAITAKAFGIGEPDVSPFAISGEQESRLRASLEKSSGWSKDEIDTFIEKARKQGVTNPTFGIGELR